MNAAHSDRHKKAWATFKRTTMFVLVTVGFLLPPVWAQEQPTTDPHAGHRMTPSTTTGPNPGSETAADAGGMADMKGEAGMAMGSMQGGSAPHDARDPHAYSGGYDFGPYSMQMGDTHSLGSLLVDNLETVRSDGNHSTAYDLQAWYGRIYDRAVLKAEGELDNGEIVDARSELLWGHAIATFWDAQLGVRYDSGDGPNRGWLAFGVQGLAPYWFEVEATGYLGETGRTALRLDVSYELLLTQKLILQPRIETNTYGKSDTGRGLGSGLSDLSAALRLRYEIRREFAPYLGIEWARKFGETEDFAQVAAEDPSETRLVAGVRFWF